MKPASRTSRAFAVALALWLASGAQVTVRAQSPSLPANMVAALSLDRLEAAPPAVATPPSGLSLTETPRLRSGFIPVECRADQALANPALVDCWLEHVPLVAAAIRWEFVGAEGTKVRAWPEWDEDSRQAVREAFRHARRWYASGMRSWAGPMPSEPPVNHEAPHVEDNVTTVFDAGTAWSIFTAHVGLSLAAEIGGWVPWSLRSYDSAALDDLFDAPRRMFSYDRDSESDEDTVFTGYSPLGAVTPSHPATTFRFLRDNRLIGETPVDTITAVLDWSRRNLRQAFRLVDPNVVDDVPRPHYVAYWHYEGKAPLVRILGGTRLSHPQWGPKFPESTHWTAGCAMTTDALTWLLRAANVPTRRAGGAILAKCNCVAPFFSAEGLYLSHGDDPYDPMTTTATFPTQALLVRAPKWKAWFPEGDGQPWCWNVGRRVIDLNVQSPSEHLVSEHCKDVMAATPREESRVLSAFRNLYTLADLKKRGLWEHLDLRAIRSTTEPCVRLRNGR